MKHPGRAEALRELSGVVGPEHLLDDSSVRAAERATFATTQKIAAIVRPADRDEVRACLLVVAKHRLAVYPISGGRNWGLGSRVPTSDGAILLDLGRMNRITFFDEEMAHVTVEPGVTFGQLYDFLKERGSRLFANTTGASPRASVVGNAIERGDGTGPYGDRWAHVCALEVVLSTGEVVNTGFGRFDDTPLGPLHRWGVGPALDGLFSQSNLGVVTRMTVWLQPLPRSLHAVRFRLRDPDKLAGLVDACRTLRLDGTIRSAVGIWNDYRVLSTDGQYPWDEARGTTPLSREVVEKLSKRWGGATWFGLTAIYAASAEQGRAHRLHMEKTLSPRVDDLSILERTGEPTSGHELFTEHEPALDFLQGIPHEGSLRSVYWRKRAPPPASELDPDRDGCGVLWVCPAVPLRGADVVRAVKLCEEKMPAHGFEPLIAMIAQTERVMYLVPLIIYDRDVDGEDGRALACHDALLEALRAFGYLPYRLGVQSMRSLAPPRDEHGAVLRRIKAALDPSGVLSPGRYEFPTGRGD